MSWRVGANSGSVPYKNQVRGWLSYAFASGVFGIVSSTLFLPICLEQFARDNGYLEPDYNTHCAPTVTAEDARCVVKIGWAWIDTASFSFYTNSISVALQALTVISMGDVADHLRHRRKLLLSFAFTGAICAMGFFVLPSSSPVWQVSSLLAIVSNVCLGSSGVAQNAYLPSLARNSEEATKAAAALAEIPESTGSSEETEDSEDAGLLSSDIPPTLVGAKAEYLNALATATSRISSRGVATGYLGGIILLTITLIPVIMLEGSTLSLRLAIGMSGVWWGFFSLPAAMWLPSGPGSSEEPEKRAMWRQILTSWRKLGETLRWREIKRLPNTFKYLVAWFLLSDGFATTISTAVLFAKIVLLMPASSLILIGVIVPTFGIIGSFTWPYLQHRLGLGNIRVIMILVILTSLAPAYTCLGFLPLFQRIGFGGMNSPKEMYGLAVYFGFVYGAFQGYSRAFYAELIPKGEEAKWFALYSITDDSSSFIGPLAVGLVADLTGNIRYGFFFVVFMIWAAVPILMSVDVERGRSDADSHSFRAGDSYGMSVLTSF